MGLGGISIWQLLIILAIVILIFGTKKLKNIGGDLGGAIKNFKKSMGDEEKSETTDQLQQTDKSTEAAENTSENKEQEKA